MLEVIKLTAGSAITVSEESLRVWQKRLSSSEGLFAEMTSAGAFAGLESLIESGEIEQGSNVCVPVTGSGLKEPLEQVDN